MNLTETLVIGFRLLESGFAFRILGIVGCSHKSNLLYFLFRFGGPLFRDFYRFLCLTCFNETVFLKCVFPLRFCPVVPLVPTGLHDTFSGISDPFF